MTTTATPDDDSDALFRQYVRLIAVFVIGLLALQINVMSYPLAMIHEPKCDVLTNAVKASSKFIPTQREMRAMIHCRMFGDEVSKLHEQGLISDAQMALSVPQPRWWEEPKR